MAKKRGKKEFKGFSIKIHLTNRWLYTFIAIGVLAIIGVTVYALAPGNIGDPGHNIQDVGPPTTCANGQVLQFIDTSTGWGCVDQTIDTQCDTSGTCSQVCIGTDCQTSWPTGISGCTLSNCANYYASYLTSGRWNICPESRPVMKGIKQRKQSNGPTVWVDEIQCCSITCS